MKEKLKENECRYKGDFDYVVIGSSFCGLSFTKRVLEKQPEAKILIIDRGVILSTSKIFLLNILAQ